MTLLTLGFMAVALMLVTVVVSATGVHLERKRLIALADLAALDAADSLVAEQYLADAAAASADPGAPETPVAGGGVPLRDADVARAVDTYLAHEADETARWSQFAVLEAGTPDGRTATVRLAAVVRPPLLGWVLAPWSDGIRLEAWSSARAS
ncbi:pilus assembly protein TadG-related protein [Cellulomonas soli]